MTLIIAKTDQDLECVRFYRNRYFFTPMGIDDPYTWTFDNQKHLHYLLGYDDIVTGYAHVQLWPENRAALRMIAIDEAHQRKGFGRHMMSLVEMELQKQGVVSLHTQSHPRALQFYQVLGYKKMPFLDPDHYESDPNDIPLGKRLIKINP